MKDIVFVIGVAILWGFDCVMWGALLFGIHGVVYGQLFGIVGAIPLGGLFGWWLGKRIDART